VWGFVGGYGEVGFSNIGTPNATFDAGVGVIGGGGPVVGAGPVEVETGVLYEKNLAEWSLPLGSGTTGQNANQSSMWNPNQYLGVVIGGVEVGGLYGCDSNSGTCTVTIFYGRGVDLAKGSSGPFAGKVQAWGGLGGSYTWPSSWWKPW
jgi:hypothetical protein